MKTMSHKNYIFTQNSKEEPRTHSHRMLQYQNNSPVSLRKVDLTWLDGSQKGNTLIHELLNNVPPFTNADKPAARLFTLMLLNGLV